MFIRKKKLLKILRDLEADAMTQQNLSENEQNDAWWLGQTEAYRKVQDMIKR